MKGPAKGEKGSVTVTVQPGSELTEVLYSCWVVTAPLAPMSPANGPAWAAAADSSPEVTVQLFWLASATAQRAALRAALEVAETSKTYHPASINPKNRKKKTTPARANSTVVAPRCHLALGLCWSPVPRLAVVKLERLHTEEPG